MKLKQIVKSALKEDTGKGDITTNLIIRKVIEGKAVIKAKESGVLAGGNVAKEVFKLLDPKIKFAQLVKDRENFNPGAILFELKGSIAPILTGERTALNFLQKLSGIATLTHKFVEQVKGTGAKILDTRKTTPNLRELEKYSVRCGGGKNHRMGLWDMILIKDNHIKAAGGIDKAIAKCKMQNV
ncbi:carboxylating nicotinate-nucleotide diphosphorylase, partial [candidate division WOR-3 bacterium]|nr:carboxylating nicotinate-nucleotide diphosphorylase [candidate division WOR-3 bacterium]